VVRNRPLGWHDSCRVCFRVPVRARHDISAQC
jgi:hypothetical protein